MAATSWVSLPRPTTAAVDWLISLTFVVAESLQVYQSRPNIYRDLCDKLSVNLV